MAAGPAYQPISTQTLTGSQATITFSSIPSTYTDLVLVIEGTTSGSSNNHSVRFNSDSGANYSVTNYRANTAGTVTGRRSSSTNICISESGPLTNRFMITINVFNYANTSTYKTCSTKFDCYAASVEQTVGTWRGTSAINNVAVTAGADSFATGTTATLYGIVAA